MDADTRQTAELLCSEGSGVELLSGNKYERSTRR
jgi:hypothetical protein